MREEQPQTRLHNTQSSVYLDREESAAVHHGEFKKSGIHDHQIALGFYVPHSDEIAEFFFQGLPNSARKNTGQIRVGYLRTYANPIEKGGWAILGYDPTDLAKEPEIRSFKPNKPRLGRDGKPIKYDFPKNVRQHPIFPRISYQEAEKIFRTGKLNFADITAKYAPEDFEREIDEADECRWFWQAALKEKSLAVTITEGGKKQRSALGQGILAIAVTSCTTWRKCKGSSYAHPWLAMFAKGRKCFIAFDQDDSPKTIKNVNTQAKKLGNALKTAGAKTVRRLDWAGRAKGLDDYIYETLKTHGYRNGKALILDRYKYAQSYLAFDKDSKLFGTVKHVKTKYLDPKDLRGSEGKLLMFINSQKGTGKTHLLSTLSQQMQHQGTAVIAVAHLQRLAVEMGQRLGIPYRTDKGSEQERNAFGYAMCFDSMRNGGRVPFQPENWRNTSLMVDEFTQGTRHMIFANTEIRKYRLSVIEDYARMIIGCLRDNIPCYFSDADIEAADIEYIYDLVETYSGGQYTRAYLESTTFVLHNEYVPPKGELRMYRNQKELHQKLIAAMIKGETLMLLSSTQSSRDRNSSQNLGRLAAKYYGAENVLVLDSKTVKTVGHPGFQITGIKLAQYIREKRFKVIVGSPLLCTGTSIDGCEDYFESVYGFHKGNLAVNSVFQQIVRLRDFNAPRHLYVPQTGQPNSASPSVNPLEIMARSKNRIQFSGSALGINFAEYAEESPLMATDKFWARAIAKQNREAYRYFDACLEKAQKDGWQVTVVDSTPSPEPTPEERAVIREREQLWKEKNALAREVRQEEIDNTAEAVEISELEARRIEKSPERTEEEMYQLDKYKVAQRYGLQDKDITLEIVEADLKGAYKALKLRFWATVGRKYLEAKDRAEIAAHRQNNKGGVFAPDLNKKLDIDKVKLLESFKKDLRKFHKEGKEWSNKSKALIRFAEKVKQHRVDINSLLRCGIAGDDSPITVAQKLLKATGYKLQYLRHERDGKGKRLRIYGTAQSKFTALCQHEQQIMDNWLSKTERQFAAASPSAVGVVTV